jgi:hypothetical protein
MKWLVPILILALAFAVWGTLGRRALVRQLEQTRDSLTAAVAAHQTSVAARMAIDSANMRRISRLTAERDSLTQVSRRAAIVRHTLSSATDSLLTHVESFDSTLAAQIEAAVLIERLQATAAQATLIQQVATSDSIATLLQLQVAARDSTISEQAVLLAAYQAQLDETLLKLSPGFSVKLKRGLPAALVGAGLVTAAVLVLQ